MDKDAKHTVILKLHEHPNVQQILLQRCGISPRWLNGKRARSLSRRTRQYGYAPAFTRQVVEFVGHDPDAYYMIGVEHRIPEPPPQARAKCVERLLDAGFSQEAVETALAALGVPPGGHHPPKQTAWLNQASPMTATSIPEPVTPVQTWLPVVRYDSASSRSFLLTFKTVAIGCSCFGTDSLSRKPLSPKHRSAFLPL